jgi:hypothetical protein
VAAPLPFSESELRLLRILLKRKAWFMAVGLSAATLQGAPVVTQDVDLWYDNLGEQKMCFALREVGAAYVPPSINNPPMLAGPGAELFDIVIRMDGLGRFADEVSPCAARQGGLCAGRCLFKRSSERNINCSARKIVS